MIKKLIKRGLAFSSNKYDVFKVNDIRYVPQTFNDQTKKYDLLDRTLEETWDERLEYNEVEARTHNVLRNFNVDLFSFKMGDSFEKLGMDDFEQINLLTSLEQEFRIVLPDIIFDNMRSCQDFAEFIIRDGKAF